MKEHYQFFKASKHFGERPLTLSDIANTLDRLARMLRQQEATGKLDCNYWSKTKGNSIRVVKLDGVLLSTPEMRAMRIGFYNNFEAVLEIKAISK